MLRRPVEPAQFTSLRYGQRLAEIGAVPSIGSIGDSYAGALAETVNGYYKAELIRGPTRQGPWKSVEDVELATLGWVHWHNTARLHGYLGDVPPTEFEAAFHAAGGSDPLEVELPTLEPLRDPGRFMVASVKTSIIGIPQPLLAYQRTVPLDTLTTPLTAKSRQIARLDSTLTTPPLASSQRFIVQRY